MPRILLLVLVATVLTARPALAENWVLVTRDDNGTDGYIDTVSVQSRGVMEPIDFGGRQTFVSR